MDSISQMATRPMGSIINERQLSGAFNGQQPQTLQALMWYIVIVIALVGCAVPVDTPDDTATSSVDTSSMIRILFLGDSYTIGEGVAISERWPDQLVEQLRQRGLSTEDPMIVARTGWTADELLTGTLQVSPRGEYDLVTLLIGVNNQYRGQDVVTYRQQLRRLLDQAGRFADGNPGRVMVISIPDWGVTPFAQGLEREKIAFEIDAFNEVNRQEAEQAGAIYVDITPASRRAARDGGLLASDGLHPSGRMYAEWVDLILPQVLDTLESN